MLLISSHNLFDHWLVVISLLLDLEYIEQSANPAARVGHYTRTISTNTQNASIWSLTAAAPSDSIFRALCIKLTYLITCKTRLPSNLSQHHRECAHLVTRVHFRSRDKDGGYTIRSAIPENPMLHANITALCLIEWHLLPIEVLHCGNRNFRRFWLL